MNIAIAIPVYNAPLFCKECLASLAAQETNDLPVYIFDDASEQDYRFLFQFFPSLNIKYFRNSKNLGALLNMQHSFNQISQRHKYLMVMHEDDLLAPEFLKTVLLEIKLKNIEPKMVLSYFNEFVTSETIDFETISRQTSDFKWLNKKQLVKAFLKLEPIAFGSAIYNTTAYSSMHLDFNKFEEFSDRPFLLSLLNAEDKVLVVQRPLYYYRSHGANDNRWMKLKMKHIFSLLKLYKNILEPKDVSQRKEFRKLATHFVFESHKNLVLSKHKPRWIFYLTAALKFGYLSPKYAFLKIKPINRFFTFIKKM